MKKSIKAALYSALLFPGAGLLWLKQYKNGMIFLIPALVAAGYIFRISISVAQKLSDKILDGSLPLDPAALSDLIEKMMSEPGLYVSEAKWIFIICWIISTVLSYLTGKKLDLLELGKNKV